MTGDFHGDRTIYLIMKRSAWLYSHVHSRRNQQNGVTLTFIHNHCTFIHNAPLNTFMRIKPCHWVNNSLTHSTCAQSAQICHDSVSNMDVVNAEHIHFSPGENNGYMRTISTQATEGDLARLVLPPVRISGTSCLKVGCVILKCQLHFRSTLLGETWIYIVRQSTHGQGEGTMKIMFMKTPFFS